MSLFFLLIIGVALLILIGSGLAACVSALLFTSASSATKTPCSAKGPTL